MEKMYLMRLKTNIATIIANKTTNELDIALHRPTLVTGVNVNKIGNIFVNRRNDLKMFSRIIKNELY